MKRKWIEIVFFIVGMALFFASCSKPVHVRLAISEHSSKKVRKSTRTTDSYVKRTRKERTNRDDVATVSGAENTSDFKTYKVRQDIVKTAKKYIGKPYNYGGKCPKSGFDCSGFTSYVYNKNGVKVSGASYDQAKLGKKKSLKDVKKGDLLIFGKGKKVKHVAIVESHDNQSLKVIHSTSSRGVVIDDIADSDYWQQRFLYAKDVIGH